jgi:hypothetical protein
LLVMEDADRDKITSKIGKLVLHTKWNVKLETGLLSKGVFKPKMIELLKATCGEDEDDRVRQLFLDVQRRGPRAFANLIKSLEESDNSAAANILDPSIEVTSPIPEDTNK